MRLLSVEQARAAWFFPMVDSNPLGKFLIPLAIAMVARYKFANPPNIPDALKNKQGLIFGQGAFMHPEHGEISLDVALYNDAIFADTRTNTDASEIFLEDWLAWMGKEYGLKYPEHIRKQYISRIFVNTTKKLPSLNPRLEKFSKSLSAKSKALGPVAYELSGINFTAEQAGSFSPQIFRFERAETVPFSQNRYFSYAGLSTGDHLELLEELEAVLG